MFRGGDFRRGARGRGKRGALSRSSFFAAGFFLSPPCGVAGSWRFSEAFVRSIEGSKKVAEGSNNNDSD